MSNAAASTIKRASSTGVAVTAVEATRVRGLIAIFDKSGPTDARVPTRSRPAGAPPPGNVAMRPQFATSIIPRALSRMPGRVAAGSSTNALHATVFHCVVPFCTGGPLPATTGGESAVGPFPPELYRLEAGASLPPPPPGFVRLVCVSDTHGFHDRIQHIPAGDIFIHAGDAVLDGFRAKPDRNRANYELFNAWMRKLPHPTKIFVPGNHDTFLDSACGGLGLTEVRALLSAMHVLVNESIVVNGLRIGGAPLSYGRSPNRAFQSRETQFRTAEAALAALLQTASSESFSLESTHLDTARLVERTAGAPTTGTDQSGNSSGTVAAGAPTHAATAVACPSFALAGAAPIRLQQPPFDVLITHHPVSDSELCSPAAPNAVVSAVLGLGWAPVAGRVHIGGHFHSAFGARVRQLDPRAMRASGGAITHVVTACACMVDEKYVARRLPIVIDVQPSPVPHRIPDCDPPPPSCPA